VRKFIAVALLSVLSLYVPAVAADPVPFHAVIQTQPTIVGFCGPTCLTLDIPGSGTASHMGAVQAPGVSNIDVASFQQSGSFTLIAPNGDTIMLNFSGTFINPVPGRTDIATFAGTWTAVGGTGRFAGGSGSGTYEGSAAGPNGILYLDGRISTVGSNKK
jgi:hypothetical protein